MHDGERFNAITHLIGTILAVVGTAVLVVLSARNGDAKDVVAMSVYGATLILLYLISTLYHSLKGQAKKVFHILDHCGIYLLIAGTYTPFALITLEGARGWWIFGIIWTLAAIGVFKDWRFHRRYRPVSYVLYLGMGWMIVFFWDAVVETLHASGIAWLIAGGIFYTAGLTFLGLSKRVRHTHGVWHICVMAGSLCHYVVMFFWVVPRGAA
jgi:hemolysin III